MTERLYYTDSYLAEFRARVVGTDADGLRVCLDRTAFYPSSGGQPNDTGTLAGVAVVDVIDEGERIIHVTAAPMTAGEVEGRIDWRRRFDHMQQHSGQHLLSAVLTDLFGSPTVSFHLGAESSTIDVAASSLEPKQILAAEERANELVAENLPIAVSFEEAAAVKDLRKESDREGTLRIVSIEGYDRSACGGTHVHATGEIGPVLLRGIERIRGNVRIEFLCGMRAVRRARSDFDALSRIARTFSAAVDDTPSLVASQFEAFQAADKTRRKLAGELARFRGRELYENTSPGPDGSWRATHRTGSAIDDEVRALAQGFTAQPGAVFLAVADDPPSVLLAASSDAGVHAGNVLKTALTKLGGRGGGNAQMAQGSVPSKEALAQLIAELGTARPPI